MIVQFRAYRPTGCILIRFSRRLFITENNFIPCKGNIGRNTVFQRIRVILMRYDHFKTLVIYNPDVFIRQLQTCIIGNNRTSLCQDVGTPGFKIIEIDP